MSFYYENGNLKRKGVLYKGEKKGIWNVYDSLGVLKNIYEYKIIKEKSFLNQHWKVNVDKDTVGGVHYVSKIYDTIDYMGIQKLGILLSRPLLSLSSEVYFLLPKKRDALDSFFTDYESIKYDTLKSDSEDKFLVFKAFRVSSIGDKTIRGVLVEKALKDN